MKLHSTLFFLTCVMVSWMSLDLRAQGLFMKFGPASFGNGGPNPLGIPPKVQDIELTYVQQDLEVSLGLPAISLGWKLVQTDWGGSIAAGPALVLGALGAGVGGYSSFAYTSSPTGFAYIAEYKSYLGLGAYGAMLPYSVRMGVGYVF